MFSKPHPGELKALLAEAGQMRADLQAPMTPASSALVQRLLALRESLNRL